MLCLLTGLLYVFLTCQHFFVFQRLTSRRAWYKPLAKIILVIYWYIDDWGWIIVVISCTLAIVGIGEDDAIQPTNHSDLYSAITAAR